MKKILLLIVVGIALFGCGRKEKKQAKEKVEILKSVRVMSIEKKEIVRTDISSGIIDPINEVSQITETGGDVIEIGFKNGDRVKKGDVILRLEDQTVTSTHLSTEADLISAKSDFETKKINFSKFEKLFNENLISEDEFLSVKNAYNQSKSALKMAEANFLKSKEDYDNLTMSAKMDGIVTDFDVKLYEKITSGTKLFTLVDDSVMRINTAVSNGEINSLREGSKAIIVPEGTGTEYEGRVYEINPVADPATKKFAVRVELPNKSGKLKKGMYARVMIETGARQGFVVPLASIVVKDLYSYIFIEDNGIAKEIKVERGYSQPNMIEVISKELPNKFNVVTEGQFLIEDGDKLQILD